MENEWYDSKEFEELADIDDLGYYEFDENECVVFGVIGGGIKSTFIYELFPFMFSVRACKRIKVTQFGLMV